MGRGRSGADLIDDALKRADVEDATDRHPRPEVLRYINQGGAELYDLLVAARGATFFRKNPPQSITTAKDTSRYALNADFYRLISVRRAGTGGEQLQSFQAEDEPWLREPSTSVPWPSHYQLQPGYVEILPLHDANLTIVVDYVPFSAELVADGDAFDGINGWEEYVVAFAARCMAIKDDQPRVVKMCEDDMERLKRRIAGLAPKRDAFRPERPRDVRGERSFGALRRWRGW